MRLKKFNFRSVNSTNSTAINIIKKSKNESGMIISDLQKKGRGQYGKKWSSLKGNLFVTIFFSTYKKNLSISNVTKINCLLIKKLLSFYYKKNITIKKPNDLMINKKKICGILQERITKDNKDFFIVGIGLNLFKSPNIKDYPTTCLAKITDLKFNKNIIIFKLKKIYEEFIPVFSRMNIKNMKILT